MGRFRDVDRGWGRVPLEHTRPYVDRLFADRRLCPSVRCFVLTVGIEGLFINVLYIWSHIGRTPSDIRVVEKQLLIDLLDPRWNIPVRHRLEKPEGMFGTQ